MKKVTVWSVRYVLTKGITKEEDCRIEGEKKQYAKMPGGGLPLTMGSEGFLTYAEALDRGRGFIANARFALEKKSAKLDTLLKQIVEGAP